MSDGWWTNIVHTGGPVRVHDDDADPEYVPPPFLGFAPPPQRRLSGAFYDPARVLTFDPLPTPELRPGDTVHVYAADGAQLASFTYRPLPTITIDEPRVEWYGSGSGSRLVEHLLVAIADQDPDEWGDQA